MLDRTFGLHTACPERNVVGETHAQAVDVLHVSHQLGLPSASNSYLINRDVADRGHQAVDICMLIFAFLLPNPECNSLTLREDGLIIAAVHGRSDARQSPQSLAARPP